MTKKEIEKLDYLTQYLCKHQYRIKIIRQTLGINTDYDFLREVQTIERIYENVLNERKKEKSTFFFISTSGWTVQYLRKKKTYEKGEDFNVIIYFSFVEIDTFD